MKKLLVVAVVALLVLALVACGGDDTATTTKGDVATTAPVVDTTAPAVVDTTVPAVADTTAPVVADTTAKTPDNDTPNTNAPATPTQGIDIMNGELEDMAIDPTWKGLWPCAFENHHPELDYRWCLVVKMLPTENCIQEELIAMDPEVGYGIAYEDYKWTLTINGEDFVITSFCIPDRTTFIYVRMDLGEWAPELGEHEYDIRLTISDATTGEVIYWAWFTDPDWGGNYIYDRIADPEMIPTEKPENVEALPTGSITATSGPESLAATETYVKAFDGLAKTKLCSADYTNPLIFNINNTIDTVSIKGISIVGANDDAKHFVRVVTKFKLYGSDDGTEGSWSLVLDVNDPAKESAENYAEYYYGFAEAVEYRYYKLVIEDASGAETPKYQFSEIVLYTEKQ